jgi:hypothetical protein
MADKAAIFDSTLAHFRLIEAGKPDATGLAIDVHIISPGWGSSGYYSESILLAACQNGVYPVGMHMHIDHPTRKATQEQPARTIKGASPLAAILTEAGHYETEGWDKTADNPSGAGVYALAKVVPTFAEDIKAMASHIGISHYVDGKYREGTAPDGKKGTIITELIASLLNTVDFVTVPGRGGHYRTFSEMKAGLDPTGNEKIEEKMADKQLSIRLSEIMASDPEVVAEIRKQVSESLKIEAITKDQTAKLTEATDKIKVLEQENKDLRMRVAESKAREFVAAQLKESKIPDVSGKVLAETLVKQVVLAEDGTINAVEYGKIVTEAIKVKAEEIAAILKESGKSGIHDNGGNPAPVGGDITKAKEGYIQALVESGMPEEQAKKLAEA